MDKRTTKPPALTDEQARLIGTFKNMVEDGLRCAATIAGRAVDRLDGSTGMMEFHVAHQAITRLLESPEFKALNALAVPPSLTAIGSQKPKGGKGNG